MRPARHPAPRTARFLRDLRSTLERSAGRVVDTAHDALPEQVDACIVVVDRLQDADINLLINRRWNRPVLWLVAGEAQECSLLEQLGPGHDVVVAGGPIDTAKARLMRLLAATDNGESLDQAGRDPLTGLLSRRSFGRALRSAIDALLPGEHSALVLLDIDHFKHVNDQFGHEVGDRVLETVGRLIRRAVGNETPIARMGGDEFAFLLARNEPGQLLREVRGLLLDIGRENLAAGATGLRLTASAGLVLLRRGATEPQMGRQVESALLQAKGLGGNRLAHFELIHEGIERGPEADLERFQEAIRMFSEQMNRMVTDMGRQLIESARNHAQFDALTRARNRGFLNERLPFEIDRAKAAGRALALAWVDLDDFHGINTQFGWTSGDEVLRRFVELAAEQLRATDWLARYGGEEFVLVLPGAGLAEAQAAAERLRARVEQEPFLATDGQRVPVTVSIGVAIWSEDLADAIAFCSKAGSACLSAKTAGKNRVVVLT
jgi:two-component system cell cycle response regulator